MAGILDQIVEILIEPNFAVNEFSPVLIMSCPTLPRNIAANTNDSSFNGIDFS